MSKPKNKLWSQSHGPYGARVRVAEVSVGSRLYLLWLDRSLKQHKRSLGHRDRKRGTLEALQLSARLLAYKDSGDRGQLTVDRLMILYLKEGFHGRSEKYRKEAGRKLELWRAFLGATRGVETLCPADVDKFVDLRKKGLLHQGSGIRTKPITNTTVWHDFVALNTALNFAVLHRDGDARTLIAANPLAGVKLSKTLNPSQPVGDEGLYMALRGSGAPGGERFVLALDLAVATGHRIDAILHLKWTDIDLVPSELAPFGSILWREEHDKMGNEHRMPITELAYKSLSSERAKIPLGVGFLFPSASDSFKPVDRRLASRWLRKAEKHAGIPHVAGRGWHCFRRGWASSRRHMTPIDVAAAGGWKEVTTMQSSYQHADARGIRDVVLCASALGSAGVIPNAIRGA